MEHNKINLTQIGEKSVFLYLCEEINKMGKKKF